MALFVKELLELESFKTFRLVAGKEGIGRRIESAGIADWEFVQGIANDSIKFEKNSLVISSLLFARENESSLYKAIEYLIHSGVSAMAYKEVFIKELPETVLRLADVERFPIFAFDSAYFEDVLVEVHNSITMANQLSIKSEMLTSIMKHDLDRNDVLKNAKKINAKFMKYICAAFFHCQEGYSDGDIIRISENNNNLKNTNYEISTCSYENDIMFLISSNHEDSRKINEIIKNLLTLTILHKEKPTLGISKMHQLEELDAAAKEAYDACVVAQIEGKPVMNFENIGIYQFVVPNRDTEAVQMFMRNFLEPIIDKNNAQTAELMGTAITFIKGCGNFKAVSESLHIHENTLRYRLGKLHKLLDPNSTEFEFYNNLNTAIKIYLIQNNL